MTIGLLQVTPIFGQNTEYDTVFVKRAVGSNKFEIDTLYISSGLGYDQVLAGTMFLPNSEKMFLLENKGLFPISLEIIEECNNTTDPETFNEYPKFLSTSRVGNTLTIDLSVIANCCHNFLGEAEIVGKDTLNLLYTSYGGYCACSCSFTLRYKFKTSEEDYSKALNFVTINNSKTVGQIVKQDSATKKHIDKIRKIFENYTKHQESTDSPDNKELMSKSLKTIKSLSNKDELGLLINVWMYYDPTDYLDISEIYRILKNSRPHSIVAVKKRIDNKKEWETDDTAPYSDLKDLLKRLVNE